MIHKLLTEYDAVWYNMTIRTEYMVGKTATEPYYPVSVQSVDTLALPTFQWAFSGNPYKVKVYNRSTGLNEVLTLVGSNAVMRQGSYEWELIPNQDGFVLRVPGTSNVCLNQFGGRTGPICCWDSPKSLTDDGSTFRVTEGPDPDGIESIHNSQFIIHNSQFIIHNDDEVYDLAGRKLNSKLPRGVYIINGKKVLY